VRGGTSLFLLLALLSGNGGLGAAQAASAGQIGTTSKGSVAVRVTVRPQLLLWRAAAQNSSPEGVKVTSATAERICLSASDTSSNYYALLQGAEDHSGASRPAVLAKNGAATSNCGTAGAASTMKVTEYRLPSADLGRAYILLIGPE